MLASQYYKKLLHSVIGAGLLLLVTVFLPALAADAEQQHAKVESNDKKAAMQQKKGPKGPKPVGVVNSSNGSVFQKGNYAVILKYDGYTREDLYDGS
ncbi:hypothetical protein CSA57_05285, partial [candidate division KSB3 bacterium]